MLENLSSEDIALQNKINDYFKNNGIPLNKGQVEQFYCYYLLLAEWNKKFNLTAITDFMEVVVKHFYDSAICFKELEENATVIDIGCGAGFPSIPLKILRPDLQLTLVDSVNKKINFVSEVIAQLRLNNVVALHSRAEDLAFKEQFRQKYKYAVSRAVANLSTLCEYCLPFVSVGGKLLAYKAIGAEEETAQAKNAINLLGGKLEDVKDYSVENMCRKLVVINKVAQTPNKFPRGTNKPRTSPL